LRNFSAFVASGKAAGQALPFALPHIATVLRATKREYVFD
jgi:hypothetical protein